MSNSAWSTPITPLAAQAPRNATPRASRPRADSRRPRAHIPSAADHHKTLSQPPVAMRIDVTGAVGTESPTNNAQPMRTVPAMAGRSPARTSRANSYSPKGSAANIKTTRGVHAKSREENGPKATTYRATPQCDDEGVLISQAETPGDRSVRGPVFENRFFLLWFDLITVDPVCICGIESLAHTRNWRIPIPRGDGDPPIRRCPIRVSSRRTCPIPNVMVDVVPCRPQSARRLPSRVAAQESGRDRAGPRGCRWRRRMLA